jgi:hypothetical protein
MRPWLYTAYFLHAPIFSIIISQFDFVATTIAVIFTVLGVILWRRKRPSDFIVRNYLPRVLVSSTYALLLFAGFLLLRKLQPLNYRRNGLAALGIFTALLAIYFATVGRK